MNKPLYAIANQYYNSVLVASDGEMYVGIVDLKGCKTKIFKKKHNAQKYLDSYNKYRKLDLVVVNLNA